MYDEIVVYLCFRNELVAAVYAFHEGGPSAIDGEMDRPTGRAFGYFNGWATTRTQERLKPQARGRSLQEGRAPPLALGRRAV